jgi:hypothetical protein
MDLSWDQAHYLLVDSIHSQPAPNFFIAYVATNGGCFSDAAHMTYANKRAANSKSNEVTLWCKMTHALLTLIALFVAVLPVVEPSLSLLSPSAPQHINQVQQLC